MEPTTEQPPKADKKPARDPNDIGMRPTTLFYVLPDPREKQIATLYVQQTYPDTRAKIVTTIDFVELTREHSIIVITRKDPSALEEMYEGKNGALLTRRIMDLKPFVKEIRESALVKCSDHFHGSDAWNGRIVDETLANELCEKSSSYYWSRDRRVTRN